MIRVENLYLNYNKEFSTLFDINFTVKKGEHLAIVGIKDSGKSCLMRILAGFEKPTSGTIFYNNQPLNRRTFREYNVGYLCSNGVFFEKKTVFDNLKYVLKIRKYDKSIINRKVVDTINKFGLKELEMTKLKELNYEQRLRVSIARLSLRKIDIMIVDDVFANGIDEELITMILDMSKNKTCIVATSNDAIADRFADKKYKLVSGVLEI